MENDFDDLLMLSQDFPLFDRHFFRFCCLFLEDFLDRLNKERIECLETTLFVSSPSSSWFMLSDKSERLSMAALSSPATVLSDE